MDMTVSDSRPRRRRGIETQRQLLEATKSLIAEHDYHSITLDQIADSVGVAKSSILWHFGSKDALLIAAVFDLFDDIENAIKPDKAGLASLDERFAYLLDAVASYFGNNPKAKGIVVALIFDSKTPQAIRERILKHLKDQNRKIVEFLSSGDESVSEAQASAIMALIHGCYMQWYLEGCPRDFHDRLKRLYGAFPL